jgi:hypothetical protein
MSRCFPKFHASADHKAFRSTASEAAPRTSDSRSNTYPRHLGNAVRCDGIEALALQDSYYSIENISRYNQALSFPTGLLVQRRSLNSDRAT